MTRHRQAVVLVVVAMASCALAGAADTALDVYRAMGIKTADVLTGSVLHAKVLPGADKQVVAAVTYLTGARNEEEAVNVKLVVYRRDGEALVPIYTRDLGSESGGAVGRGELQVLDLDDDGLAEIIVTWDVLASKLVEERRGEVIVHDEGAFVSAWSGPMAYDATKAVREVPDERRDRFSREIDFQSTLKTRGITLFINKTVYAVAGERLPTPQKVQETFQLRSQRP